jgi:hypothetical protein
MHALFCDRWCTVCCVTTTQDDEIVEGAPLGEGWVGASRPAAKLAGPPVADRSNRKKLYTTVAVKESTKKKNHSIFFLFSFVADVCSKMRPLANANRNFYSGTS